MSADQPRRYLVTDGAGFIGVQFPIGGERARLLPVTGWGFEK